VIAVGLQQKAALFARKLCDDCTSIDRVVSDSWTSCSKGRHVDIVKAQIWKNLLLHSANTIVHVVSCSILILVLMLVQIFSPFE